MTEEKITPLSEKLNQFERYGDKREVDQIKIWNDVEQALKGFCDEIEKIVDDMIKGKILVKDYLELQEKAKLKHFGEGML